ncbi:hypothetical protein [Streptomyces nogalater]|uniref:Uncharacterized protein n=1 Tax=Streptomyces nogalater TaxID=38314 RepID=A0ABW0WMK1_STRNO
MDLVLGAMALGHGRQPPGQVPLSVAEARDVRLTPIPGRLVTFVVQLLALTARRFGDRPVGRALGDHAHGTEQPVTLTPQVIRPCAPAWTCSCSRIQEADDAGGVVVRRALGGHAGGLRCPEAADRSGLRAGAGPFGLLSRE